MCKCREDLEKARLQKAMIRVCDLPLKTDDWTFDKFVVTDGVKDAYEASLSVSKGELSWLTLVSKPDMGKSHLAIAICRKWLELGKAARYSFVPELLESLRPQKDSQFEETDKTRYLGDIEFYKRVPLLVLDDFGAGNKTSWAVERLEMIIDHRYSNGLPLVVTTNLSMSKIGELWSWRIASRLQRVENSKVVSLTGTEYRLRKNR